MSSPTQFLDDIIDLTEGEKLVTCSWHWLGSYVVLTLLAPWSARRRRRARR
jgi:hypothetical protein